MAKFILLEDAELAIKKAYDALLNCDKKRVYEGMQTALDVVRDVPATDPRELYFWASQLSDAVEDLTGKVTELTKAVLALNWGDLQRDTSNDDISR